MSDPTDKEHTDLVDEWLAYRKENSAGWTYYEDGCNCRGCREYRDGFKTWLVARRAAKEERNRP